MYMVQRIPLVQKIKASAFRKILNEIKIKIKETVYSKKLLGKCEIL